MSFDRQLNLHICPGRPSDGQVWKIGQSARKHLMQKERTVEKDREWDGHYCTTGCSHATTRLLAVCDMGPMNSTAQFREVAFGDTVSTIFEEGERK